MSQAFGPSTPRHTLAGAAAAAEAAAELHHDLRRQRGPWDGVAQDGFSDGRSRGMAGGPIPERDPAATLTTRPSELQSPRSVAAIESLALPPRPPNIR